MSMEKYDVKVEKNFQLVNGQVEKNFVFSNYSYHI